MSLIFDIGMLKWMIICEWNYKIVTELLRYSLYQMRQYLYHK